MRQHPHFPVKKLVVKHSKSTGVWVAQSVDYDICAQAKSLNELWKAFGHVYYGAILVALENNEQVRFSQAPFESHIEWAKMNEDPAVKVETISWDRFIPDWVASAMGTLVKMYGPSAEEKIETAQSLAA